MGVCQMRNVVDNAELSFVCKIIMKVLDPRYASLVFLVAVFIYSSYAAEIDYLIISIVLASGHTTSWAQPNSRDHVEIGLSARRDELIHLCLYLSTARVKFL
ncbi:hypothetical protein EYC80_006070 [Monilinia laxa]|uniref:Uncharacterized protein n=1 Tax=Monilinia laxa TaxID=61186 RepID=A0A5N6KG89_MONLA|nr:hypothetical protein EYC80_006070 [Monilinia laxa]